jgi:hypothetical protein
MSPWQEYPKVVTGRIASRSCRHPYRDNPSDESQRDPAYITATSNSHDNRSSVELGVDIPPTRSEAEIKVPVRVDVDALDDRARSRRGDWCKYPLLIRLGGALVGKSMDWIVSTKTLA